MIAQRSKQPTAGIILAAGMSIRLGQTKQLVCVDGVPLVARVTAAALASRLDRAVLVLGHRAEAIARQLGDIRNHPQLVLVTNPDFAEGMSTSIHAGLSAVREECRSVMILLGDLPLLDPSIINRVLHAFHAQDKPICLPVRDGRRGHPVCLSASFFDALMALYGDQGAREIIRKNPSAVNLIDVDDDGCFFDIDTPQDLTRLKNRFLA